MICLHTPARVALGYLSTSLDTIRQGHWNELTGSEMWFCLCLSDLPGFSKLARWILLALWVADMPFLCALDWLCSYLPLSDKKKKKKRRRQQQHICLAIAYLLLCLPAGLWPPGHRSLLKNKNRTRKRSLRLCDPVWVLHHFNFSIFRKSSPDCYPGAIIAAGSSDRWLSRWTNHTPKRRGASPS